MMNTNIALVTLVFSLVSNLIYAAERKVDENGNEYFISTAIELESTNSNPSSGSKSYQVFETTSSLSFKEIALEMKAGCTALDDVGQPGAVVVNLEDFFVVLPTKPNGLPPRPGEAGEVTIHGIDSDQDCIRDDIEHVIFDKFSEESQSSLRKYLFEYAIWLDFFLIQGLSEENARTADREMSRIGACIVDLIGSDQTINETQYLFSKFHNTFERSHRYIDNSAQITGWTQKDLSDVTCT